MDFLDRLNALVGRTCVLHVGIAGDEYASRRVDSGTLKRAGVSRDWDGVECPAFKIGNTSFSAAVVDGAEWGRHVGRVDIPVPFMMDTDGGKYYRPRVW